MNLEKRTRAVTLDFEIFSEKVTSWENDRGRPRKRAKYNDKARFPKMEEALHAEFLKRELNKGPRDDDTLILQAKK